MSWIVEGNAPSPLMVDQSVRNRPHEIHIPAIYFDGASAGGIMGCGVWVKKSQSERVHIFWNGGFGTNSKAEIMAFWGGLLVATMLNIQNPSFYGNSKMVIEWINGRSKLTVPKLRGWMQRIYYLWNNLNQPPIKHIYREANTRADGLSKKGVCVEFGQMYFTGIKDGDVIWNLSVPVP